MNDYLEQGTRIGEYKNARMGYEGMSGRLQSGGLGWTTDKDLKNAKRDKEFASYRAKEITLDFQQHGEWGGFANRYIPFFNASLQGTYKLLNFLEECATNKEGL